ncbi:MAG: UDP-N-acetylglucosamine 1-carboxyvinyltransferase, partial [Candidatus Zixiibacteriota bacterium]
KIHGAGTPEIVVEPVKSLKAIEYTVPGDRLIAGTFMIGTAMTGGEVTVTGVPPQDLTVVSHKLIEMGCRIEIMPDGLTVTGPDRLSATNVTTFPFPGFPTDLQACIMAAAATAEGTSRIRETVFADRFSHTMEFRRLGADIAVSSGEATINGVKQLHGAEVMAPDIRAGAGIVLACLAAQGVSGVQRIYHVDRGYHRIEDKLTGLGADINRISV